MLDKEDVSTAKEIAKVLRESKDNELVVVGNLITVLLAEREQHCTAAVGEDTRRAWVKLTDEQCDAIYNALDEWAREIDSNDFGLPVIAGDGAKGARPIIRSAYGITEE